MHPCLLLLTLCLLSLYWYTPCFSLVSSSCPRGCCCPRPGVLVLCESLGLHVLPRSVPLTTSALSVARNRLCNVDDVLQRYSSLQQLSLSHNRLERFPRGLPTSLESLQLQENRITYITAGVLRHLGNLTRLDLEDNRIRAIQPAALLGLSRLRTLSLKGNRLSSLPLHLPPSLTHLDVSANCITTLDLNSLGVLVNLQVLKINSNCLHTVPEHAFDGLPRLRSVELANNLWVCECDIMYLYRWLLSDRLRMAKDLVCSAPLHLAHKLLLTLSVMAICPKVLKQPNERLAPLNSTKTSSSSSSEHAAKSVENSQVTTRTLGPSCRNSYTTSNRTLPASVNLTLSRSHFEADQSSLEGLSYANCLLLNSTYLIPQSTRAPPNPKTDEAPGCTNTTVALSSTVPPATPSSPVGEAVLPLGSTPRTVVHSSNPALVALLSVLCVLTALLLVTAFLVLRSLLWRNQRVAPQPDLSSSQRNVNS